MTNSWQRETSARGEHCAEQLMLDALGRTPPPRALDFVSLEEN